MSNPIDIERLMAYDGITPEVGLELERKLVMAIEKKRREVRHIRIAVVVAWLLLLCLVIAGGIIDYAGHSLTAKTISAFAQACLIIALFLTVSWHVRSVSLRFTIISDTLAAIQNQLSKKE
jgi:membrane protein YdbS with pleckstrin-like domain